MIALQDDSSHVGRVALATLTDKALLAKVSTEGQGEVRGYALGKLADTNQAELAQIAAEHPQIDPTMLQVASAFAPIPREHRPRLIVAVLPIVDVLHAPDVVNHVGEMVSMKTAWTGSFQNYVGVGGHTKIEGETFKCSIATTKLRMSESWTTEFPYETTRWGFIPAPVRVHDLLDSVFGRLPQSVLANIAMEADEPDIREAAVEKLTDQTLLEKIAAEDPDASVRYAAQDKLKK
jgi:hypothetical protein